jgi:ribonuclease P/MRP protein subunit POP5
MARLKPSEREKKRYIVFEISSGQKISFQLAKNAILDVCLRCIGEFGCQRARIYIIENLYIPEKNRGVLRVTNKSLNEIRAALAMVKCIDGNEVVFQTIGISGILKKAKYKFLMK